MLGCVGDASWVKTTARRLGPQSTCRAFARCGPAPSAFEAAALWRVGLGLRCLSVVPSPCGLAFLARMGFVGGLTLTVNSQDDTQVIDFTLP